MIRAVRMAALLCVAAMPPVSSAAQTWTLEDAVTSALAQHPLVEAARARVDAARYQRASASRLSNPAVTFWLENDLPRETSLYFTYPLESMFQRRPVMRRAEEDARAAAASLLLAQRAVAAETVRAFFGVALAQALGDEAQENRGRLHQLVAYTRARVGEGITAEGELLRLEVELDRAAHEVVLAEVESARSRARLAPYLGGGAQSPSVIRAAVPPPALVAAVSIPSLDVSLASARARRPEIAAARARAAAAEAAIAHERSLAVSHAGATLGAKRTGGANSLVAGLNLSIPLFNRNSPAISRATSEQLAAQHELQWVERAIVTSVQGTHGAAAILTDELRDLPQTFVARAERVHQLTLAAYGEGGATLLQVLDATRTLTEARLTYSRALFAQRENLFELALSIGSEPIDALAQLRAWSAPLHANIEGDER